MTLHSSYAKSKTSVGTNNFALKYNIMYYICEHFITNMKTNLIFDFLLN